MDSIAKALKSSNALKELDLSGCNIDDKAAAALAAALATNKGLANLNISGARQT